MYTEFLEKLRRLPAADVHTFYRAFTCGIVRPAGLETDLLNLSDSLPYGRHELGWYLRWLVLESGSCVDPRVLRRKNLILSRKTVNGYLRSRSLNDIRMYAAALAAKPSETRLDCPAILRYDSLLRIDLDIRAVDFLKRQPFRAVSEFLGLPFVRVVLLDRTEADLWTLSQQQTVC
jgi:hypothetical protein